MKKRILVVDDDSMNLARTQIILGKEYDVLTAESGLDALMRLKDMKVDMVLLDIDMPKMNGLEVLRSIRRTEANVPILMLTAKAEIEDRRMSLRPVFLRYTAICPGKLRGFPETIFLRWMKKRRKPIRKRYF